MGNPDIAQNIKRLRKEHNISQATLANTLDISIQAVSKWECGNSSPDITLIPLIADFFGITIDELFRGRPPILNPLRGQDLPDDGVFRVVQAVGRHILRSEQYSDRKTVRLEIGKADPLPERLEFCAPTRITGDLTCDSLIVHGDLKITGKLSAASEQIDGEKK
ncbi:MAG: helix-turn-helix domain-containing protein [Eubacteriales bacterium]